MINVQPYSRKWFEKMLVDLCGDEISKDKLSKKYLKRMSVYASEAYKLGIVEGKEGKTPVSERDSNKQIELLSNMGLAPELVTPFCEFSYSAYQLGYTTGRIEKGRSK